MERAFPDLNFVDVVVTTRRAGNLALHVGDDPSTVLGHRQLVAEELSTTLDMFVFCEQVHGGIVATVRERDGGRGAFALETAVPGVDALVTVTPGLVLVILVADCVPVALVDVEAGVLGVAHAGWRGTAARIVESTVGEMIGLGADVDRIAAYLGPAVAPSDYEVGSEVAEALIAASGSAAVVGTSPGGRALVNLVAANRALLLELGVRDRAIEAADATTGLPTPYFSHRAEAPCGRFALAARLNDRC